MYNASMAPLIFSIESLPNHLNVRKQNGHEYYYTNTAEDAGRGVVISAAASSAKAFEARALSFHSSSVTQKNRPLVLNQYYNQQWLVPIILLYHSWIDLSVCMMFLRRINSRIVRLAE